MQFATFHVVFIDKERRLNVGCMIARHLKRKYKKTTERLQHSRGSYKLYYTGKYFSNTLFYRSLHFLISSEEVSLEQIQLIE